MKIDHTNLLLLSKWALLIVLLLNHKLMTTIELLEESLKQLKIIQLDNLRREPDHPRNKFDYTVIVPDHPLGYHEHYTNDLQVAKKSAIEWATDYGKASVEDRNLDTVFAVR